MSWPSNTMRPLVGRSTPVRQLKKVDLPAPLGPMMARISPRRTLTETPLSAVRPPKRIERPSVLRITGAGPPQPVAAGAASEDGEVTLGELARGGNDRLVLGNHVDDLVLARVHLEHELPREGLVILAAEGLVALREVVALLHLEAFQRLDELHGVLAPLEPG